jgi:hypothetical protein
MKMVRKQVYITKEQDAELKRLSRELGMTEAEVVRCGIELVACQERSVEAKRREAADRIIALLKERAATVPGTTVKWRREDAYDDERHARLLR